MSANGFGFEGGRCVKPRGNMCLLYTFFRKHVEKVKCKSMTLIARERFRSGSKRAYPLGKHACERTPGSGSGKTHRKRGRANTFKIRCSRL
jgi:hypothetical protein